MDHFHHLEEFRLLVCKACQYAVLRPQLDRHLRDHHKELPVTQRRAIVNELSQLDVLQRDEEVLDMRLPDPGGPALPCLPVHDGFRCTLCNDYVGGSPVTIQRHCRGPRHSWRKSRKEAGYPWQPVRCQTFFTKRSLVRYFEVSADPQPALDVIHAGHAAQLEALCQQHSASLEQEQMRIRLAAPLEVNMWLERTGWAQHLEGQSTTAMAALVSAPVDGDGSPHADLLKRTGKLVDLLMLQASKTAHPQVCGIHSLFVVNSLELGMEARQPLRVGLQKRTLQRYSEVWKKILYYILRTHRDEPLYTLTAPQLTALQDYLRMVERHGPPVDSLEMGSTAQQRSSPPAGMPAAQTRTRRSGSTALVARRMVQHQRADALSSGQVHAANPTTATATATQATEATAPADASVSPDVAATATTLLKFCIQLLDHEFDREYDSAVISGLALIAINGNGWTDPQNYTQNLSAVIKVAQMLVVQHAWEMKQCNLVNSVVGETKAMTKRFLQTGTGTPINWIYHLRRYGRAISKWTSAPGTVSWLGDTLRYRTIEFSMEQFRLFVHRLTLAARKQLHEELLLLQDYSGRPPVALAKLKDDAARSEPGWSFVKDVRNHWLVDGTCWLKKRIVGELHDDWLHSGEELRWKMDRVRAYMASVTRFMDRLLVLMHVTGGQPARSRELLSIRYCNTATGGRRNIFLEDGLVVYVTEYHKG